MGTTIQVEAGTLTSLSSAYQQLGREADTMATYLETNCRLDGALGLLLRGVKPAFEQAREQGVGAFQAAAQALHGLSTQVDGALDDARQRESQITTALTRMQAQVGAAGSGGGAAPAAPAAPRSPAAPTIAAPSAPAAAAPVTRPATTNTTVGGPNHNGININLNIGSGSATMSAGASAVTPPTAAPPVSPVAAPVATPPVAAPPVATPPVAAPPTTAPATPTDPGAASGHGHGHGSAGGDAQGHGQSHTPHAHPHPHDTHDPHAGSHLHPHRHPHSASSLLTDRDWDEIAADDPLHRSAEHLRALWEVREELDIPDDPATSAIGYGPTSATPLPGLGLLPDPAVASAARVVSSTATAGGIR